MKRRNDVFRCRLSECNRELPPRYKGAQRIFCNADCRKKYHKINKKREEEKGQAPLDAVT